ncbi:hypothetical protein [Skermania piniformis]|uniref:hypothetical protein n=1 Tax=Skermania pinensis TaxID=39122 RepID=UPI00082E7280|nr:hypothetical protein [Skermania piniformis]
MRSFRFPATVMLAGAALAVLAPAAQAAPVSSDLGAAHSAPAQLAVPVAEPSLSDLDLAQLLMALMTGSSAPEATTTPDLLPVVDIPDLGL